MACDFSHFRISLDNLDRLKCQLNEYGKSDSPIVRGTTLQSVVSGPAAVAVPCLPRDGDSSQMEHVVLAVGNLIFPPKVLHIQPSSSSRRQRKDKEVLAIFGPSLIENECPSVEDSALGPLTDSEDEDGDGEMVEDEDGDGDEDEAEDEDQDYFVIDSGVSSSAGLPDDRTSSLQSQGAGPIPENSSNPVDVEELEERIQRAGHALLTEGEVRVMAQCFVDVMESVVENGLDPAQVKAKLAEIRRSQRLRKAFSRIVPVSYEPNSAESPKTIKCVLKRLQQQHGFSSRGSQKKFCLFAGDQKVIAVLKKVLDEAHGKFDWVMPIPGDFHTSMNFQRVILRAMKEG